MTFCLTIAAVRAFGIVRPTGVQRTTARLLQTRRWSAAGAAAVAEVEKQTPIPVTLLSGFLGSGKTTALKHLLENTDGYKIGVIVNDVANVNIDAKLVSSTNQGTIQLQNGCACCSLADELMVSVQSLLEQKENEFDAIVVELSGVADPVAVKTNWDEAKMSGHPATQMADLKRVVTVVDACTFGTDWMTWDMAGDRDNWTEQGDDCSAQLKVPELLAEQVEAANLIIINKVDLAGEEQVNVATTVARGINAKAKLYEVEFGRVKPGEVLGMEEKNTEKEVACTEPACTDSSHSRGHDHACKEPDCADPSHSHDNAEKEVACTEPACTDSSHSHDHDHACKEPDCTDPTHNHDTEASCDDADCTDETHSHSHKHEHSTSADKLGIVNFVYKATRPFDTGRLMDLLNQWPVPIKEELDIGVLNDAQKQGYEVKGAVQKDSPFIGVLRSKGFSWFAPMKWAGANEDVWRHDTAMYWSHAGKHFGISSAGKWWGTISQDKMKDYFVGNEKEYDRIIKEDFASEEWSDRRQEIVFIGTKISEDKIKTALDICLLTDIEMDLYRQTLKNFNKNILTADAVEGGPSLFDVGGTDHMDL